tara:strand:+ start:294 stop:530 length:237 start_codon:yes stop_codon:yes gene_type:complete
MEIPSRIIEEINVMTTHGLLFEEWMDVKKYLLRSLPAEARALFSTRDPRSKKQSLNFFEKNLVEYYQTHTGKNLKLPR